MSSSTEILIVGAGVLGLCAAVELTRRGHAVTVLDPGGPNASSVAAGMIAPALESAIDDVSPDRAALLRDARAEWTRFAAASGVALRPGPAVWRGAGIDDIERRLRMLGFDVERRGETLLAPDDVQIEPGAAMAVLRAGVSAVTGMARTISAHGRGWRVVTDSGAIDAGAVVIATGAAAPVEGLPEPVAALLAHVEPVRGQIGWTASPLADRVLRGPRAYVAPSAGGTLIGATMEPGRRDLDPDPAAGQALLAAATGLLEGPVTGPVDWRVGVRGATPDGLPMAGLSGTPGLHLALAPRRNGWLLGPLTARIVADGIEGDARGPHAAALDPRRFARA